MSLPVIALTGASGRIGGMVAGHLNAAGIPLILLLRNPAKAPALDNGSAGVTLRRCAYGDRQTAQTALRGVDILFMVSASESPTRETEHCNFVAAAHEAGIRHMVYLSFADARTDSTFTLARTHAVTEAAILDTGMACTFLRDNFYSEMICSLADGNGTIKGPAGNGRVACVAQTDVAEAAACVLRDLAAGGERHLGQTYTLTGAEALTLHEVAEQVQQASGRPCRYREESIEEAYASRRAAWPDTPDWELDAWVSTYTAIANGELAEVSPDLPRLIGRAPRTLWDVLTRRIEA